MPTNNDYDNMLWALIPMLKTLTSKSGKEGTAYFIDDNYIVKTFDKKYDMQGVLKFYQYCHEIQAFHEAGCCSPNIYSFMAIPEQDGSGLYSLYILEERMPGHNLYNQHISKIYNQCSSFCTEEEFNNAISFDGSPELYAKIAKEFIKEYINTNEQLLKYLENSKQIDQFIQSDYYIKKFQKHSSSDVHEENVLFDGKYLSIIDCKFEPNNYQHDENVETRVLVDIIFLMSCNHNVLEKAYRARNTSSGKELKDMSDHNIMLCNKLVELLIERIKALYNPKFKTGHAYITSMEELTAILANKSKAQDYCEQIGLETN